jgi:hypothetical protein
MAVNRRERRQVTERILATFSAGDLITMCAWCRRVTFDSRWYAAPAAALGAIDARNTLSHSICPACASELSEVSVQ